MAFLVKDVSDLTAIEFMLDDADALFEMLNCGCEKCRVILDEYHPIKKCLAFQAWRARFRHPEIVWDAIMQNWSEAAVRRALHGVGVEDLLQRVYARSRPCHTVV